MLLVPNELSSTTCVLDWLSKTVDKPAGEKLLEFMKHRQDELEQMFKNNPKGFEARIDEIRTEIRELDHKNIAEYLTKLIKENKEYANKFVIDWQKEMGFGLKSARFFKSGDSLCTYAGDWFCSELDFQLHFCNDIQALHMHEAYAHECAYPNKIGGRQVNFQYVFGNDNVKFETIDALPYLKEPCAYANDDHDSSRQSNGEFCTNNFYDTEMIATKKILKGQSITCKYNRPSLGGEQVKEDPGLQRNYNGNLKRTKSLLPWLEHNGFTLLSSIGILYTYPDTESKINDLIIQEKKRYTDNPTQGMRILLLKLLNWFEKASLDPIFRLIKQRFKLLKSYIKKTQTTFKAIKMEELFDKTILEYENFRMHSFPRFESVTNAFIDRNKLPDTCPTGFNFNEILRWYLHKDTIASGEKTQALRTLRESFAWLKATKLIDNVNPIVERAVTLLLIHDANKDRIKDVFEAAIAVYGDQAKDSMLKHIDSIREIVRKTQIDRQYVDSKNEALKIIDFCKPLLSSLP